MGGLCTPRIVAAVLIGAGACATGLPACAGDVAGYVPPYPGSQLMVYVRRAIGVHGPGACTFGLRYERATPLSVDPAARYAAPLRHRSLVELQFGAGMAPRMQFGSRVTWDMGRRRLGPTGLALAPWPMSIQPLPGAPDAAWVP
ncbi:MAG: hypothetical protein KGL25_07345 [Gammaproteobacteria bacterium]|nr:hypothetical protein [Gammaproteobacteria bacterium]MDE2251205.1 hypothetical protein [Gammaproteobacteria bacterium]